MVYRSTFPHLEIPKSNILSYLYPPNQTVSDQPIWIDASNPNNSLSPRQMLTWVRRLGYGLDRLGIRKGEVVIILTPNHIFVPVAYQGIVGSGRVFSGANPTYTQLEIEHQLKDTGSKLILVHPSLVKTAVDAASRVGILKERIFQFADHPCETLDGVQDWRDFIGSEDEAREWRWDDMADTSTTTVATINYSSGTTGLPKGVCVSHRNLIANVEQTIFMRDQGFPHALVPASRPPERWVGFLPLYHAYGQLYACLMAPKLGFPVYIMRKFVYEEFLATIERYGITHLQVAPPILIMLDKRSETARYNLSSVRNILCGAAPLSRELQNTIQNRFKTNVVQGWGMTEVTCGAIHVPGGLYDESGSVGMLDPNCECKLLDEEGRPVRPGEPGELHVRGPNVCLGYWRNDKATKESLDSDGWLKTGDIMVAKDDCFWVVDRKKELIKVNALQVSPAELEAVLLGHDGIADAGVVGFIANGQECPRAYVQIKEEASGLTEADIQSYMKDRVAKHKQITGGIQLVDEVPRLASGKLHRRVLKEWAQRDAAGVRSKL
ncbi:acyl--CoA ligase [Aspergillus nidulans FGSC A4]|uniref:Uncharacterized protein n=1 Tax=Emericella nidulans (strain FGSC A4 / ATCC 38163 / CBS 112.46 / NRRL 194 / M139) TaxID=227321 RepID=C8VGZ6_EMENI|nr:hypothetical protein [Aspergillus nidulans FGSC A4]CBF82169.1 TPA: conserved hypothetical protein [Aspergillus nidulans FGSC A4]